MTKIYTDFASKSKRSPCNIMKSFVLFFSCSFVTRLTKLFESKIFTCFF